MFNFFRKSKKDGDKKNKDTKDSQTLIKEGDTSVQGKDVCKNNLQNTIQKAEIALESESKSLPNYSSESGLRKNVSNASSAATGISPEKNDLNSDISIVSPNPDIIATMCDKSDTSIKMIEPVVVTPVIERRTSCVKPCGHGTTAVTPRIPVLTGSRSNNPSPSSSPILEIRKHFRITGIENVNTQIEELPKIERKDDMEQVEEQNMLSASMKLSVNLPTPQIDSKIVEIDLNEK